MKKNIITSLIILSLSITTIGCSNPQKVVSSKLTTDRSDNITTKTQESKNDNDLLTLDIKMDFTKSYDSINSLKNDSEIIVKGTVIDSKSYMSGSVIITEFKLKVEKSYNKILKDGEIVTIATSGGIVNYSDYLKENGENNIKDFEKDIVKKNLNNPKIKMTIGKNNLIEIGKRYIIFANTQQISPNKKMYCTINVNQGQFELINNNALNNELNYSKTENNLEKEINKN